MGSVMLEGMSSTASSLQATPFIGAADTGPPAALSATRRHLGFIITILMAESHLRQKGSKKKLRKLDACMLLININLDTDSCTSPYYITRRNINMHYNFILKPFFM